MNSLMYPQIKRFFTPGNVFAVVFYSALTIFLLFYLQTIDISELRDISIAWPYVFLATLLGLTARYWGAFIWLYILRSLGAKDVSSFKHQLFYVYAKAWLGRYIPGTAPWILGKIYFASKHGISKNKLAVSSLLEGGLQVIVTMTLASLILLFDERLDVIDSLSKAFMGLIVISGVLIVSPPIFNRFIRQVYKLYRKKAFPSEHEINGRIILGSSLLYVIAAILGGLALFFVAKSVFPELPYSDMLFVIGAGSLSGAVSMLAFFAPSGLGVREGIQLVLLSLIMPTEVALVVTVFTRVWSIAIDGVFLALTLFTQRIFRRQ